MNVKIKKPFVNVAKLVVVVLCVAGMLFFMPSGCGKQKDDASGDTTIDAAYLNECNLSSAVGLALNCEILSFFEGLSGCSKCSDSYLVKGTVLDKNKYGLNIKFVDDLKGNFPKNAETFVVWGTDDAFENVAIELNRFDQLSKYKKGDVLIMHLIQIRDLSEATPFEKQGDYATLTCTSSVLKLSGGVVTGYLTPVPGFNYKEQTMSWRIFRNNLINIKEQITN